MPRCQMCDHCDEVPSIYAEGLIQRGNPGRVQSYEDINQELCWRCRRESHVTPFEDDIEVIPAFVVEEWDEVVEGELPVPDIDDEDYS